LFGSVPKRKSYWKNDFSLGIRRAVAPMGFSYPLRTWWDFSQTLSTRTPETQKRQALTALGQKLITKTIHARLFFPGGKNSDISNKGTDHAATPISV
jgi:hypothetical protein